MRRLASRFARNGWLKLAALALAIMLWTAVRVESPLRQNVTNVPVQVDVIDTDWALSGDPVPATVEVRVNGTTRDLLRLANDRPRVMIPIEEVAGSDSSLAIRREWVRFSEGAGVQVEDVQPGSVRLTFERVDRVTLPFVVSTRGLPGGRMALSAELRATPQRGVVTGPGRLLDGHVEIPLEALDLSRISEDGVYAVRIDTLRMSGLRVDPEVVDLTVRLDSAVQRVFASVPVELEGPVQGLAMEPSTVSISVWGARSLLADLDSLTLRAVARAEPGDSLPAGGEMTLAIVIEGAPQPSRVETEVDSVTVRSTTPLQP